MHALQVMDYIVRYMESCAFLVLESIDNPIISYISISVQLRSIHPIILASG